MLDLKQITEEFIRTKLQLFGVDDPPDRAVLQAIDGIYMDLEYREKQLLQWLNLYKVLLFFPPEKSREVARQIIGFADERRNMVRPMSKDLILSEYNRLQERIRQVAPTLKTGLPRRITSLTSKALWCCCPYDVPIFDSYALRALQVISRLCGMTYKKVDSEYECFIEAWFQIYEIVKPVIELADLKGYPYHVRVLDRLLWYIGQPSFDASSGDTELPAN